MAYSVCIKIVQYVYHILFMYIFFVFFFSTETNSIKFNFVKLVQLLYRLYLTKYCVFYLQEYTNILGTIPFKTENKHLLHIIHDHFQNWKAIHNNNNKHYLLHQWLYHTNLFSVVLREKWKPLYIPRSHTQNIQSHLWMIYTTEDI